VVAREGGPAEQICHGETGLIVDLDRSEALADAIQALLGAGELRRRLGAAARARAATCSWDRLLGALFPEPPATQPLRGAFEAFAGEREEAVAAIG
jgi:glycosyltransferase involved in cell wall biosynthesis